jgi:hypothetical protein
MELCDAVDLDDGYSHLGDAFINNLCFFFEDLKDSFCPVNTSSSQAGQSGTIFS